MTNFRKSVAKPALGAGAAKPKKGDVRLIYADDILSFPEVDATGVQLVGNIVLKQGAKVHKLYLTPTSQKASHTIEGDEDAENIKKKVEASHPGDEVEIAEFVQGTLGEGVIILLPRDCGANSHKVIGLPCNPLKMKGDFMDDKDGVKHNFVFEQLLGDRDVAKYYSGAVTFAENFQVVSATALAVNADNGYVYQLPATAVETAIGIATMTLPHGSIISLVGSGGAEPAVLSGGALTTTTALLKDDTDWVAYEGAVINLQVFDAGATTYLVEVSRS